MRRRYTSARFADRIEKIRSLMPDAFIGIDVITGFPGEGEVEFEECYDFLAKINPSFLHIFPYSERENTPAIHFPDKVSPEVSMARAKRLEGLSSSCHYDFCKQYLGTEFNVDTLCAKLHMSRSSLYNKIKALTGHSPSDFVRQIRMDEAATLLKSNQYSIAEISDKLGFGDPKYFTDIFKKHYGVTPSAYMKKEKK